MTSHQYDGCIENDYLLSFHHLIRKLKWQLEFSWLMLDRCLSNMRWATSLLVQVPLVKPNQLWPIKAWCPDVRSGVPYGIWHWNGCSGVCFWRPGPPWIRLVPTRPTDCRSDWDLGTLEVRSTPHALCPVPQSVLPPGSVVMRGVYLFTNNAWMAGACQVEST